MTSNSLDNPLNGKPSNLLGHSVPKNEIVQEGQASLIKVDREVEDQVIAPFDSALTTTDLFPFYC